MTNREIVLLLFAIVCIGVNSVWYSLHQCEKVYRVEKLKDGKLYDCRAVKQEHNVQHRH